MTGLEFAHQLEISVDGTRVFLAQVGGEEDLLKSDTNMSATGDEIDERQGEQPCNHDPTQENAAGEPAAHSPGCPHIEPSERDHFKIPPPEKISVQREKEKEIYPGHQQINRKRQQVEQERQEGQPQRYRGDLPQRLPARRTTLPLGTARR